MHLLLSSRDSSSLSFSIVLNIKINTTIRLKKRGLLYLLLFNLFETKELPIIDLMKTKKRLNGRLFFKYNIKYC